MTAKFRIPAKEYKNAVVLPREKILTDKDGDFVYTVDGKHARKAAVKIGPVEKGLALVLEGLSFWASYSSPRRLRRRPHQITWPKIQDAHWTRPCEAGSGISQPGSYL